MTQSGARYMAQCLVCSEDGYVRLNFEHFCCLRFARRTTIPDDALRGDLLAHDVPAHAAGYCNWLDTSAGAQVSVGWAWFVTAGASSRLLAPGGVTSNVMLVAADGRDLGAAKTDELLQAWLSCQSWQDAPWRRRSGSVREPLWVH